MTSIGYDRVTQETISNRVLNVNRRLGSIDSGVLVRAEYRNGHCALDECRLEDERVTVVRTLTVGTKREVADFLHAMMVGIDLSRESAAATREP